MTQVKRIKRSIHGVLLLDKPLGFSSNQALQKVKWLFQAEKAGHTGTLDPLATGLLPICLGEATKFAQVLTDADKTYIATMRLGLTTTTGDAEGAILTQSEVQVTAEALQKALAPFTGDILQVPPMYSALKVEGKALYEYARAGVELERKPRAVRIHALTLLNFEADHATLQVTCSKGTYIRTLAEDIGRVLGCGAHLVGLRRTETAGYRIDNALTLTQLEDTLKQLPPEKFSSLLAPVDSALQGLPNVVLNEEQVFYFRRGQAVLLKASSPLGDTRVYTENNREFIGLGDFRADGHLWPKRLVHGSRPA